MMSELFLNKKNSSRGWKGVLIPHLSFRRSIVENPTFDPITLFQQSSLLMICRGQFSVRESWLSVTLLFRWDEDVFTFLGHDANGCRSELDRFDGVFHLEESTFG